MPGRPPASLGEIDMKKGTPCQLTTKDAEILAQMLDRSEGGFAFLRLLREKLNWATFHFAEDIPDDVVTLNSRVVFSVNGRSMGPHILVQAEGDDLPPFALSIHSMRGLALLGLSVGEVKAIEYEDGTHEMIAVEELAFQPEADRKQRHLDPFASAVIGREPANQDALPPNVVSFRQKRRMATPFYDGDPGGDDPGPHAA
jgi:regulator of nucleoside diphosphate kinase